MQHGWAPKMASSQAINKRKWSPASFIGFAWFTDRLALDLLKCASLVLLAFCIYFPCFRGEFIWDDIDIYIVENELLKDPQGPYKFWFTLEPVDYYPLTYTTFWLEYQFVGESPLLYHINNTWLHGLTGVIVFLLLRRLHEPLAFGIAAIFVAHPLQVESVAWICQRKTILSSFFAAWSMLSYAKSFDPQRASRHLIWSCFLFALSLAAKPTLITLPVAVLVNEYFLRTSSRKPPIIYIASMFALSLIFGAVGVAYQQKLIGGIDVREQGFLARFLCQGWAIWFYVRQFFSVGTLSFVYPRWHVNPALPTAWLPLLAVAIVSYLLFRWRDRLGLRPFLFWAYFLITMFPILGMVDVFFWRYSYVGDHYIYQSFVALPLLIFSLVEAVKRPWCRQFCQTVAFIGVIVFSVVSHERTKVYQTEIGIWKETLEKNPNTSLAWTNLGALTGSMSLVRKSLEISPDIFESWEVLAEDSMKHQRWDEAIQYYRRVGELAPEGTGNVNWAIEKQVACLIRLGRGADAVVALDDFLLAYNRGAFRVRSPQTFQIRFAALRVAASAVGANLETDETINRELKSILSQQPDGYLTAGKVFDECGLIGRAADYYAAYTKVAPTDPQGFAGLGQARLSLGDVKSAYNALKKAYHLDDRNIETLTNLGVVSMMVGDKVGGLKAFETAATESRPDFGLFSNLGLAYLSNDRPADAASAWKRALTIQPDNIDTLRDLAWLLSTDPYFTDRSTSKDALAYAQRACELSRYGRYDCLDALAAALANRNEFEKACDAMQQTIVLAKQSDANPERIRTLEQRLTQYSAKLQLMKSEDNGEKTP
ncbi:hypothetical protein [Neorhodopirellula pilleata]|uniref:Tetratricopeptide repeat protein n=1 Tax=Neorhodopirellula pilleata TaxID=2714738 RepID=A0A5C5ZF54_9BACT|nr:hypothetical protein [Neorhodopirellula pilleata]TWT86079.1 Tetratricopeptide repeat protein [Neorhodopirellula pilleata]